MFKKFDFEMIHSYFLKVLTGVRLIDIANGDKKNIFPQNL